MREVGTPTLAIGDHVTFDAAAIGCAGTQPHAATVTARCESGSFTLDFAKSCSDPECFAYRRPD